MKFLITGSAGFIGMWTSKKLLDMGHTVIGIDNLNNYYDLKLKIDRNNFLKKYKNYIFFKLDLSKDIKKIDQLIKKYKINHILHFAAQANVRYSLTNPTAYLNSNLIGFFNLLELCKKNKIKNLIYASSSSAYGNNFKNHKSFSENLRTNTPKNLYAASKICNEILAHSYSEICKFNSIGLRFFTVYGPWGRPDMAYFSFTDSIINGKSIQVFNNGNMMRDLTYVDDVCQSLIKLINKPALPDNNFDKNIPNLSSSWCPYRVFNIGNSNPIKLLDFIEIIEDVLNIKAKKEFMPMQPGDVKATYADCSSLEKWIGFQPKTSFKEGIEKFIKWYLTYYKKIN